MKLQYSKRWLKSSFVLSEINSKIVVSWIISNGENGTKSTKEKGGRNISRKDSNNLLHLWNFSNFSKKNISQHLLQMESNSLLWANKKWILCNLFSSIGRKSRSGSTYAAEKIKHLFWKNFNKKWKMPQKPILMMTEEYA